MLGWFEWDEVHRRLRVVIPPWDCVDAPRQPADVVKQRQQALSTRLMSMQLTAMQRGAIKDYLGVGAHWIPEEFFEFAQETMICFVKADASLFESAVSVQSLVSPPFNDLVRAGNTCRQEIDDLVALALLMSRTTRRIYLIDQVSRTREKLHDDRGAAEPHASINHLLVRLEAAFLIAPPGHDAPAGAALIPAQADRLNTQIRRLLRRMVFSMDSAFHATLASTFDALVKAERQSIFHHLAEEMEHLAADVPLFAICEPLWVQMGRIAGCKVPSALPDSPTLAREVLDQADAWITACAGTTYRYTRTYLIGLGNQQPTSPQLIQSHELLTRHTRRAAQQRLNQRQRWLSGPVPTVEALTLAANPGAEASDDSVHTWPVDRLVRWINGPVTSQAAAKALANQDKLLTRDNELLAQDRQRSGTAAPARGQKDNQALTKAQAQEIVWRGLTQSAEYLRDELRDLGALADQLGLKGADRNSAANALKSIETALQAMGSVKRTTTIDQAQAQLATANSCLEGLRAAIKPVQVAADKLLHFGECLVLPLRQETLAMGKHHGGVIGCPMALDQWGAVRDRFHRRYCSPVQALTMDGESVLLRSDQALALHVTAGSQSGYAFDVSVHLWQRVDESKDDPFDTSTAELFPPMNTQGWFDTFITCAVLHVPLS